MTFQTSGGAEGGYIRSNGTQSLGFIPSIAVEYTMDAVGYYPSNSGSYLGKSSNHWGTIYVNNISLNGGAPVSSWPTADWGGITINAAKAWNGYAVTNMGSLQCGGITASSVTVGGTSIASSSVTSNTFYGTVSGSISGSTGSFSSSLTCGSSVTLGNVTITGSLKPTSSLSYNLGTSSLVWNWVYAHRLQASAGYGGKYIDVGWSTSAVGCGGHFYPVSGSSYTCGGTSYPWSDVRTNAINGSSFSKLKNIKRYLDDEVDFLSYMPKVIEYTWKKEYDESGEKLLDEENKHVYHGFLADDLPPEIATEEFGSVNVLGAIGYAFGAIKQLKKQVDVLNDEITKLKANHSI
jgi:hypothetical protein